MKKICTALEDLLIAVTFAEAGAYETLQNKNVRPVSHEIVRVQA